MNTKIMESISDGILRLNETKEKYFEVLEKGIEKKDTYEVMLQLSQEEKDRRMKNLENKVSAIRTRIDYINFMLNELTSIKNFVEVDDKADFNNHCMYFGSGNLYYSNKFLKLSKIEIFETILNHVIYYTGSLYIINNRDLRLSYVLTAFSICYGENINIKNGKQIFNKYNKEYKYNILDVNKNYRNFIMRNNNLVGFFKDIVKSKDQDIFITYRIVLGNNIKLQNMKIKIEDNKFSVAEVNEGSWTDKKFENKFFKLA